MEDPATLVWMAPEPPDVDEARAISSWARAHGIKLQRPRATVVPSFAVDDRDSDEVELRLEAAREATDARDADATDRALTSAESILRAHPEMPQAAWLMAEALRAKAARLRRVPPTDEEAADNAWIRAQSLDGGRVPGVGERGVARDPEAATLSLDCPDEDLGIWLDGVRLGKSPAGVAPEAVSSVRFVAETRAGLHALVATRAGVPVWAQWVETPRGESVRRLSPPRAPSCSTDDVARARVDSGHPGQGARAREIDARGVRCQAWIGVIAGVQPATVMVATCEQGHCGPLFEWRASSAWTVSPSSPRDHARTWPAWATWGLVGVGVALATGALLGASGAFKSTPAQTLFVSGGVQMR